MDHFGKENGSIAAKMAAAFELRKLPEYAEVIIRLLEQAPITGSAAPMLKSEPDLTVECLRRRVNS